MNDPQFHPIRHRSGIFGAIASRIGGRSENQDSFMVSDTPLGLLVVVCDGMGGGPAGKTASQYAAEAIVGTVVRAEETMNPADVLRVAVKNANKIVVDATIEHPELRGMGTTCVAVLVNGDHGYIAHVGDSRCYQIRDHAAVFRTADHSYVGELVRQGKMTEEEARNSNYSNVITRAIGGSDKVDPEIDVVRVAPHDRFALMSDGIWGMLPEQTLINAFSSEESIENIVADVVETVDTLGQNKGGGHDNLTLSIIEIPGEDSGEDPMTYSIEDDVEANAADAAEISAQAAMNAAAAAEEARQAVAAIEEKSSVRKWRPLFWIAVGVCVILAAVTVWSVFFRTTEETEEIKKVEAAVDSLKNKSQMDPNAGAVTGTTDPSADSPLPTPKESKDAATGKIREIMGHEEPGNAGQNPSGSLNDAPPAAPPAPAPQPSGPVADLTKAKNMLETLKDTYSSSLNKSDNKDEFKKREKERNKLRDNIVELIEKAKKGTDDENKAKAIEAVKKKIKEMKVQIDANGGQPTEECIGQVGRYSKELGTLIKSL